MKTHISKKAIELVAVEYAIARKSAQMAGVHSIAEYFRGKAYSIVETYAQLTSQPWVDADMQLRTVYAGLNPE